MTGGGTTPRPTIASLRSVLVVDRTLTTTSRLLDVLSAINRDRRIAIYWTVDEGSQFAGGLTDWLRSLGVNLLSWEDAVGRRFDLVIAAHANGSLRRLHGKLVVLQHGVGFNRLVPFRTGDSGTPAGISSRELMADGVLVPDHLGVSDDCLLDQLRQSCPEAVERAFVMGDPTWDRITHNRDAWRHKLRADLRVLPHQRVVAISSTWSPASLLGQQDNLIERLLAQLPADEYKVVLVAHPNVWAHQGDYHLKCLLADAHESGLVTVVHYSDWHVAAVLADIAVGDHGSVSVYFAALGVPFFRTGSGEDELAAGSTTRAFVETAQRLDAHDDIRARFEEALRLPPSAESVAAARRPLARQQGQALERLRDKFYGILDLVPDRRPKPESFAPELLRRGPCTAFHVIAELCSHDGGEEIAVERFPAALSAFRLPGCDRERVLVAEDIEADSDLLACAEVVVCATAKSSTDARAWTDLIVNSTFCSLAGVVCGDGFIFRRGDSVWRVRVSGAAEWTRRCLLTQVAGALHRWLVAGREGIDDGFIANIAGKRVRVAALRI